MSGILWADWDIMRGAGYGEKTGILWEEGETMGGPGYYGRIRIL